MCSSAVRVTRHNLTCRVKTFTFTLSGDRNEGAGVDVFEGKMMSQKAAAPSSPLMSLHSDSHQQSILGKFDQFRKRDLLCDITLVVEDEHFKAHKALLAATSEYFSLMFTAKDQSRQSVCRLDGVAAKMFAAVLDFIYSGQVSVEESAAEQLLATAHFMKVGHLVQALTEVPRSASEVRGHDGEEHRADPVKHRRGRPKKSVPAVEPERRDPPAASSEDERPKEDGDYIHREHLTRKSRRKVRPPVKFKGYRVEGEAAGGAEPGRRGRKRKYPDTEARCDDCGKVFKSHLFLKIHQRTHTGEKPFHCTVCGKSFTQKHTLLAHQRMHTGEKPFICSVCSKALTTKHSLQEHMNLHQEKKSFDCDKCGKSFTQKRQLKSHHRVHTGKSLPECAQCHHKFMDAAQLKKHIRTHTGEKPFTCDICGKCFTAKSTLQTHMRIHRGEKPYDCNICKKSFSDPSARRRHVASHSGKKPFTCSFCSLSFTRLDNLKTHTKSHNKERAVSMETPPDTAAPQQQKEARGVLQLQLPPSSEQEIQLVVTGGVNDINFSAAEDQVSLIAAAEGGGDADAHPRLTLLTQPAAHVQNVALVAQGGVVDRPPQIHAVSMLEGHVTHPPEQMHVITLSKEAMEQLQAHHGPPQPLHVAQRPPQPPGPLGPPGQAIHISSQSSQPISISQTSEQISSHHIQGQTFQIQAGTVSYLYTTGLPDT
ncbi:LOW QUALITY PROTEIN: zinc finger and BTB domain-containing protein 24-like [Embiotoca jacksoni]|uniref:LOW QUALITY PROTEIN: zinc finger and BTB domain-containing protein 24-like n=1 Tax=Embiotoca jacksoni TaxID=100190 RepID=UPI003704BEC6